MDNDYIIPELSKHAHIEIWRATSNLRFLERIGPRGTEKILQQEFIDDYNRKAEWRDVPMVKEG